MFKVISVETRHGGRNDYSGPEKGVITKGVFSLEESLESLKSLNSLESLEKGSDSPLFSTVWRFSKISRISRISRNGPF